MLHNDVDVFAKMTTGVTKDLIDDDNAIVMNVNHRPAQWSQDYYSAARWLSSAAAGSQQSRPPM